MSTPTQLSARVLPDGPPSSIHLGRRRTPPRARQHDDRPEFVETDNRGPDELVNRPQMFAGSVFAIRRGEDMQYFWELGPATRCALDECFFRWCALDILREMSLAGLDPANEIHDLKMAYEVERNDSRAKLTYLRSVDDAYIPEEC
jgi:hypothetical protein